MHGRLLIAVCGLLTLTTVIAETKDSAVGPSCWAGTNDGGRAIFIPCHPSAQHGITDLDLDLATLSKLRIHIGEETITVSREQVLKALADWQAENRAKP